MKKCMNYMLYYIWDYRNMSEKFSRERTQSFLRTNVLSVLKDYYREQL